MKRTIPTLAAAATAFSLAGAASAQDDSPTVEEICANPSEYPEYTQFNPDTSLPDSFRLPLVFCLSSEDFISTMKKDVEDPNWRNKVSPEGTRKPLGPNGPALTPFGK